MWKASSRAKIVASLRRRGKGIELSSNVFVAARDAPYARTARIRQRMVIASGSIRRVPRPHICTQESDYFLVDM